MKSAGVKLPLHFGQMLQVKDLCRAEKAIKLDCKEAINSSEGDSGKDNKLKAVVGNMSSNWCFQSSDSAEEVSENPSGLPEEEAAGNDEAGKLEDSGSMNRLNFCSVSVIGRRRVMEDALTVAPGKIAGEYEFFAAYDGHGSARVANACRDRLHHLLAKELEVNSGEISRYEPITSGGGGEEVDWTNVMKACFSKMDEEVRVDHMAGEAESAVGSTAVVVMVGTEELVVANCGDSRAVLYRGGVAMPLSNDHKPDRPDEKERVEAAGGQVINWEGWRVQGVLATSRSIGDHYLKPCVISEPEIRVIKREDTDYFLIIATDGMWDVVSNDVACEVVRRCLNRRISKRCSKEAASAAEAATILAELAIAKGSRDNISVIVVDLSKESSHSST